MLPQRISRDGLLPMHFAGAARASLVLLAIDRAAALELLKGLTPAEVRAIVKGAESLPAVDAETLGLIAKQFEVEFKSGLKFTGSATELRTLLEEAIGRASIDAALNVEPAMERLPPPWPEIAMLPDDVVRSYVLKLPPQAGAFVLSRLDGARIVGLLQPASIEVRNDLLARLISVRVPDAAVLWAIEDGVREDLLATRNNPSDTAHRIVAGILNQFEQIQVIEALSHIERHRPEDAKLIRRLLFRFEDIGRLSPAALSILVERVPVERLVVALNQGPDHIKGLLLDAMAPRARRMAESELNNGAPVTAAAIGEARRFIAAAVLKLAADGEIEIGDHVGITS